MKRKSILNFGLAILILIGSSEWLAPAPPVRAAGVWYVAPGGNDLADCTSPTTPCATIGGTVGKAADGDTVLVAIGVYTATTDYVVYVVSKSIAFSGGWDATFSEQKGLSIIDGQNARQGIVIENVPAKIITIDHFLVQNGYSSSYSMGGGGIFNGGKMTLTNSVITHNTSDRQGGGIYNYGNGSSLTIINSSISYNSASQRGGGIAQYGAPLNISNSTISGNSAPMGGGIYSYYDDSISLNSVTIVNNTATTEGGGISTVIGGFPWNLFIQNTILANNGGQSTSADCSGTLTSKGYNLIQDTSGCSITGDLTGNLTGTDPLLLPFLDGRGYYPLSSASPAVDAGNPTGCLDDQNLLLTTDQRGAPRVGRCDIGAYEYTVPGPATSLAVTDGSLQSTIVRQPFTSPLQVRALDALGSPAGGAEISFAAPLTGAGGTFQDNGIASITTPTDEGGFTPPLVFIANSLPGTYTVSATTSGVTAPANFVLTNLGQIFLPMVLKPDPATIVDEYLFTDRCTYFMVNISGQDKAKVTMCVTRVRIRLDGQMYFDIQWSVQFLTTDIDYIYKNSDANNPNMNVTDNLGNRYDHVDTGGAAAQTTYFYRIGGPYSADGWYLFPAANSGAIVFTFHDDDQQVMIDNIVLSH